VAVILDGYVPRYRVRLYELLAERSEIEYVVFHGKPPAKNPALPAKPPFRFPSREVRNVELGLGGRTLIHQRGVQGVARKDFDAIVIGAQLRFVSSLVLLVLWKLRNRPLILWGQGFDKDEDVGGVGHTTLAVKRRLKRSMARGADGYLVYTAGGRERLVAAGLHPERVFVVQNTLDVEEQITIHNELQTADVAQLRSELGLRPDSVVLVFVGRLYREKRVPELLEAVRMIRSARLAARPIEVVVIGQGPELADIRAQAERIGDVHVRGQITDQVDVARHMRVAAAVVIPGAVGLAANHAFAQGVPLITMTGRFHGPELEYLEHGRNGLIVDGEGTEFARALAEFCDSPAFQRDLAKGALRTRDRLGMEKAAAAFDTGVREVLAATRKRGGVTTRSSNRPPLERVSAPSAVATRRAARTGARGRAR
jgi:glycosyltransferase involved in cell wall biosynthesis